MINKPFILASASPRRLALLQQIGLTPVAVEGADINESPLPRELPRAYGARLAMAKASAIAKKHPDMPVLAADTVVACGRRILPKAESEQSVRACLELLSGRRHQVWTFLALHLPGRKNPAAKEVCSIVRFKRLEGREIDSYLSCGEGVGKAGGYAIQGMAGGFVAFLSGSYSNVVGLPLYETRQMLLSHGILSF
ncbi:MAG: septum formation protein Maf [Alphaproteobacteria bacterium]|nr:septum formation protein Maf [Alphaproteobacteria bacterium]